MPEETVLATLASEVEDARDALLEAARTDPGKSWTAAQLIDAAKIQWPDAAVMIALDQLITDKAVDVAPAGASACASSVTPRASRHHGPGWGAGRTA